MYSHIKRFFLSINDNGSKKITATLVFVFLLTISSFLKAELINIDHYSVKDGLSENTVVSMFQDRKGNMWFGTFAGLNRFDGYQFSTYKAEVDSKSGLSHNRVDYITEDSFGFLWLITYTGEVQRFNPKTEEFLRVPDNEDMEFVSSPITKLYNFSSGEIWLATKNSGAFRVLTNPVDFSLKIDHFGKNNQYVNTDFIHSIYKDWQKNVWLMSDNGLIEIPHNKDVFNHYFENSSDRAGYESQAFYCATETDIEILFGSSNGRVWIYNKQNKTFLLQTFPVQSNIIEIKALPDDKLLILTSDDGFVMYSHKDGVQKHYTTKNSKELKSDKIISVYIDYVGEVWLETYSNGVTHFNPKSGDMKFFSVKTDKTSPHILLPNYRIFEDKNNRQIGRAHV